MKSFERLTLVVLVIGVAFIGWKLTGMTDTRAELTKLSAKVEKQIQTAAQTEQQFKESSRTLLQEAARTLERDRQDAKEARAKDATASATDTAKRYTTHEKELARASGDLVEARKGFEAASKTMAQQLSAADAARLQTLSKALADIKSDQKKITDEFDLRMTRYEANIAKANKQVYLLRFPPLLEDERAHFELDLESVSPLSLHLRKSHVSMFLTWPELHKKPDEVFLKKISSLLQLNGCTVTDKILEVKALQAEPPGEQEARTWIVSWEYAQGDTPIPFTYLHVYESRIRIWWYPQVLRRTNEDVLEKMYRSPLRDLRNSVGAPASKGTEWDPVVRKYGYSDLLMRN